MATQRNPQPDICCPVLGTLDYCVNHDGPDDPDGRTAVEGYLGPSPDENPALIPPHAFCVVTATT
ncbi:MAG: hypothetical protein OXH22_05825 [Chloroflexi bacterium]|nr:hypothetical protein [Chloroflexota bacterium]